MSKLLIGKGRTTESIANHLDRSGVDFGIVYEDAGRCWLQENQDAPVEFAGSFSSADWVALVSTYEKVIFSPGIDPRPKYFEVALQKEEKEIHLFRSLFRGKIVAVTGTNGKSNFCFRLAHRLRERLGEHGVFLGGNIGKPMFDLFFQDSHPGWAVLELSSFQLERAALVASKTNQKMELGVLLNLQPDHLDRYDSLEDYYSAKMNLAEISQIFMCSERMSESSDHWRHWSPEALISEIFDFVLDGLSALGSDKFEKGGFDDLPSLPHRLESFGRFRETELINDSKATNLNSVHYALHRLLSKHSKICLLMGGKSKSENPHNFIRDFPEGVSVIVFGAWGSELKNAGLPVLASYSSLRDCLKELSKFFDQGFDCLVLSPGASSWDEFTNFEERGEFFKEEVLKIASLRA